MYMMAGQNTLKMSLVAQYDDLCRYSKVLTSGAEEEFKVFGENQLNYMRKRKRSESELKKLSEEISDLVSENKRLQTQIKLLKNLIDEELNKRRKVESERDSMERQISLIKDVLKGDGILDDETREKLGFLKSPKKYVNSSPRLDTIEETVGSLMSLSDTDQTSEDLDATSCCHVSRKSKERQSRLDSHISSKKHKPEIVNGNHVEPLGDSKENNIHHKHVSVRSNSEPSGNSPKKSAFSYPAHKSDSSQFKNYPYELRRSNTECLSGVVPTSQFITGGKLNKTHSFVIKVVYRPEKCHPCQSNIGFLKQALKCQDCRVICHEECKTQCPLPCIPLVNTPPTGTPGMITDYISESSPMIPPLIIYCVNEIESRGLREIGLYRIPGSEREVKLLKEKFMRGHAIPYLNRADVHALCGTIKEFLRSLKEPLVTYAAWEKFVKAASLSDNNTSLKGIYDLTCSLPQANRDTIVFLILHFQRVAASHDCKMPINSLAKMLGPTVVGYSTAKPADILKETDDQYKVMKQLLSISSDQWKNLLNAENDVFLSNGDKKTPDVTSNGTTAQKMSRLGPFQGYRSTRNSSRTPHILRNSKYNRSAKLSFSSPILK